MNYEQIKKESTRDIRKIWTDRKENMAYWHLWAETVLRGKFIGLFTYLRKDERSQLNDLGVLTNWRTRTNQISHFFWTYREVGNTACIWVRKHGRLELCPLLADSSASPSSLSPFLLAVLLFQALEFKILFLYALLGASPRMCMWPLCLVFSKYDQLKKKIQPCFLVFPYKKVSYITYKWICYG